MISWTDEPSIDINNLLFFTPDLNSGQNDSLTQVSWLDKEVTIPSAQKDAQRQSFYWSAQSIDTCGLRANDFDQFDYHKNMVVEADFLECDSTMNLSWNGYYYFNNGAQVEYEVERLIPVFQNGAFYGIVDAVISEGTTTDTTFSVKVDQENLLYAYRVVARPIGTNGLEAFSSWDTARAVWGAVPAFNYISKVDVRPTQEISIDLYRDTLIGISGLDLYKGSFPNALEFYRSYPGDPDTAFVNFLDADVNTDAQAYYYQIIVKNACGNPIDTTNPGNSIHLSVTANNEALTNMLRWNQYEGWEEEVAFYNIYRGINGEGPNELYATVPAGTDPEQVFIDDVYDNIYAIGNYCYKVEAVQGTVSPTYSNVLDPATSTSNMVCVVQEPLMYVPNAFSPNGVNKVFGPSGQFFDFTLFEMMIYNRWGELIYETRDINKGWDGSINGEEAPLGSYVYNHQIRRRKRKRTS